MRFILTPGRIEQLDDLRSDYERERKVALEETPSLLGKPTLFGGTNVKTRRRQISFLEKVKAVLQRFFLKEAEIKTIEQWQAMLMASRIMIAAVLYVQDEINSPKEHSVLYRLLNKYLGVTAENFVDNQDKENCYHTVAQVIAQHRALNFINDELRRIGSKEITVEDWENFSQFISKVENRRSAIKSPYSNYPVTGLILPVFEKAFSFVGSTLGWVVAETINTSQAGASSHLKITSLLGTLLVIGPGSTTGVVLLAPVLASSLIRSFCTTSMIALSETSMRLIGKGTGILVGLPFDLVYNLLKATGSLINNYTTITPALALMEGIRIADGVYVMQGTPIQFNLISQDQLNDVSGQRMQITEQGKILVNDQPVDHSHNPVTSIIHQLNAKLKVDSHGPLENLRLLQHPDLSSGPSAQTGLNDL